MEHEFRRTFKFVWEDVPYRPESFRDDGFYAATKGSAPLQWRLFFRNEPVEPDRGPRFCMYLEWVKHNASPEVNVSSATMKFFHKDGSDVLIHELRKKKFSHTGNFAWADDEIKTRAFEEKYVRVRKSDRQRIFSVHVQISVRMTGCLNAFYTAVEEHKRCMQSYATDTDLRPIELIGVQPNGLASASVVRNGDAAQHGPSSSGRFSDDEKDPAENKAFKLVTAPPVSRNMLIRMAPVFATMLGNDMVESHTLKVNIVDFAPNLIAQLAEYCRAGPIKVDLVHNASDLVYIADKYEANGLVRLCTEAMKCTLNENNVMKFFRTSVALNLHDLRELCLEFLESPEGINKLTDFMDMNLKPNSGADFKLMREINTYYAARTIQLKQKLKTCSIKVPRRLKRRYAPLPNDEAANDRKRSLSAGGGSIEEADNDEIAIIGANQYAGMNGGGKRMRFEDHHIFDVNAAEPNSSDEDDEEERRRDGEDNEDESDEDEEERDYGDDEAEEAEEDDEEDEDD